MPPLLRSLKSRYGLRISSILLGLFTIIAFLLFFAANTGMSVLVVILLGALTVVMVVTVLLG